MTPLEKAEACRVKLAEMRKACDAATAGPWKWEGCDPATLDNTLIQTTSYEGYEADKDFIASSRTWLPQLLDAQEARLKQATETVLGWGVGHNMAADAEQEIAGLFRFLHD